MKEINNLSKFLTGFLFLFLITLLLTFPFNTQEIIAGFAASLIVALLFRSMFAFYSFREPFIISISLLFAYLFFLLFEILKANIHVAKIVLSPKIKINSAIVSCRTSLTSELGRSILANSITLTPGTLTMEIKGDRLFIHCIDIKETSEESTYENIVKPFEEKIKRFAI